MGLTDAEVARRRAEFGFNELPAGRRVTPWEVLARQFKNVLVILLIVAAIAAYVLGERIDTIAILLVVVLNAGLGFVQEWRAENALDALRGMLTPRALAVRNGVETEIDARELVPGDHVLLAAGDNVPADLSLVSTLELKLDESVLTGESLSVAKTAGSNEAEAFMGTSVVAGRAEGVVSAIGAQTAFGQIAGLTGAVDHQDTNLGRKLGVLARQLGLAAVGIALLVLVVGLAVGKDVTEMFMTGLSLAVALVPEGLPAVVTITLALGAAAMVRQKALVRRLQAVETLGAASVICTDKTGTLTENKMTASAIWTLDRSYEVTGTGYDPAGHIEHAGQGVRAADDPVLAQLLDVATSCSHARLLRDGEGWTLIGEPTEGALETLAYKGWSDHVGHREIRAEVPFSSERKRMSVLCERDGRAVTFTKGAPEKVLELCENVATEAGPVALDAAQHARVMEAYAVMAGEGLRVIALASGDAQADVQAPCEEGLTFLGLVGLIDPPRPEVRDAVAQARAAGIRVIVITGDATVTARAIATRLGIPPARVMTGDDVRAASDTDLADAVAGDVLFARTRPADKMRIVEALQSRGQIVAMTGDGVNDAPALKQADIGVSMGIRGTHVAKEASDLVLLDDNFATIVRAIAEGRRQFENVKKFVRYLLCSNAGEIVAILLNILMGGPLIFLATQILWMNLVTDGVTAVTLGVEKAESDQMAQKPRPKEARILGRGGLAMILLFGAYTGLASYWIFTQMMPLGVDIARTTAFTAMVFFEKASVFAFRSLRSPCWRIGWLSNPALLIALGATLGLQVAAVYWPPLQTLLRTVSIGWESWSLILGFCLPLIVVPELVKTITSARAKAAAKRG